MFEDEPVTMDLLLLVVVLVVVAAAALVLPLPGGSWPMERALDR